MVGRNDRGGKAARAPAPLGYPLRTVARLTGLTPDLIRAWERRYQVVRPARGPRGARLYDAGDIELLRLLATLVAHGRAIGDIARLDRDTLTAMVAPAPEDAAGRDPDSAADALAVERILTAAAQFDTTRAESLLGEALVGLGATAFVRRIGLPLLDEVGQRWSRGTLSVAEEHMLSAMLRSLTAGLGRMRMARGAPAILLATPSGERHELGLSLVALLCGEASLPVVYLGADVPAADIVRAAEETGVAVVGLSVVHADALADAVTSLRLLDAKLAGDVEIWLGGAGAAAVARRLPRSRARVLHDLATTEAAIQRLAATRRLAAR
jgi:DNA-binding transcriptional MerR regulator/methylmalonyl-CoA mutase cobalamin-binding subunit